MNVYFIPGLHTVRLRVWSAGRMDFFMRQDLIDVNFVPRLFGSRPSGPSKSLSRRSGPGF